MTRYNSLNVKLSNSQLNKLKSSIKNENDEVLRISSNMVGNSNDNTNFPHELLLTNRQVADIRKAFTNHSSIDIKLSTTQLSKMIQSGGFLGNLLGKLMYEFWYDYVKRKYGDMVKLCYMDTDILIMNIKTKDFYKDIAQDVEERFDTSNYDVDRPLPRGN